MGENMDIEIKRFVDEIISSTHLDFCVFDGNGKFVAGNENKNELIKDNVDGIITDVALNKTYFKFNYKSKTYIGRINGASKNEVSFAHLIGELAERTTGKVHTQSREEFFKSVILGEASFLQIEKNMKKYSLDNKPSCVMIVGLKRGITDDVLSVIQNYGTEKSDIAVKYDETHCAFIKFTDESTGEYRSFTEYAEYLADVIYEEFGERPTIALGGTVKNISDLSTSFTQALSAQRMKNIDNFEGGVFSFKDFVLIKMLEDLPKYKLNEYLELLMDSGAKEIFSDEEMISTADAFLDNNLNVSETSRIMYLHRNTLNYRLDKIERATGLNLRKFSDAVTFRLITFLSKLVR